MLITFIIYERLKKEKSYWHSFFEIVDPGTEACNWPETALNKSDDPELKMALNASKLKSQSDWE